MTLKEKDEGEPRPKLLLDEIPPTVRGGRVPMSEVDVATVIRLADSTDDVARTLTPLVSPGREVDGWICQVNWAIPRNKGDSSKYRYRDTPTLYEFTLRFPQKMQEHEVWIWGHNYDFDARAFGIPNDALKGVKGGDWVRISGVFRPGSKVEWGETKSSDILSLGEIFIRDVQMLDGGGEADRSK